MNTVKENIKKRIKELAGEDAIALVRKLRHTTTTPLAPTEMLDKCNFEIGEIDIVIENGIDLKVVKTLLKNCKYKFNYFLICEENYDNKCCQIINKYTFNNVFRLRSFIYIFNRKKCSLEKCYNISLNSDICKEITEYTNSIAGLKLLSNYNQGNNISVKTSTFFNYLGTNYYAGGAERYLLDLYEVCNELGFNLNIYQHGEKSFFRKYHNVNVIGLNVKDEKISYNYTFIDKQTKNYIYSTFNNTSLHIYSAFQECYPNHIGPSIGISHGISWDNKNNHYSYGKDFFWENKKIYLDAALFCNKLVSVDTNTPNWFQTVDYNLAKKFNVIPNYVDNTEFKPRKDYLEHPNKIVITYPRRLYEPRGLYVVLDIIDEILKKYDNVEFHFVGKGLDTDIKNIDEKIKKYPGRIKCYNKAPQEMKKVYKYTDISLIPTQCSEGTSLSCLEALASGNIVIATRIGGLTDLVINKFNGYLIEPSSEALKETLIYVLDNYDEQKEIRKRAIESTKSFNKEIWKERWKKEISSFKLKNNSENNDLIEIYANNLESLSLKTINIIKKELMLGNLIYLRIKNLPLTDNISHGLLQLVSVDEENVNIAKKVYKEKDYLDRIERKEKIIVV